MVLDPSIPLQTRSFDTLGMLENGSRIAQQWQQQNTDKELGRIYNEAQGDLSKMMELGKQSKMARFVMPQLAAQQSAQDKAVLDQQKSIAEISKTNSEAFKNTQQGGEYGASTSQKKLGALNQAIMQGAQSGDKSAVLLGLLARQQAGLISSEDLSMQTKLIQAMEPEELKQYASNVAFAGAKDPASLIFTDANTLANNATSEANNVRSTNASIYATDTGAETADKNRAQQQSQFNTTQAFNQQKLYFEQNKPIGFETGNDGYRYAIYPNGKGMRVLGEDGQPIKAQVKGGGMTEQQSKDALFGSRMQQSNVILNSLEKDGTSATILSRAPLVGEGLSNILPSFLGGANSKQQQYVQAQRDFINAVLRKESGAAIADSEFANAQKQYFPQLGDSDAVIKQKAKNRQLATDMIINASGNEGRKQIQEAQSKTTSAKPSALSFFQ